MSSGIKVLTVVQAGVESVKGTLVAATRRLVADARFRRIEDFHEFEEQNSGVFARVPRGPVKIRNASELDLKGPFDFQQILLPLLSGMVGSVTGVGAGADKTWTFTPSVTAPVSIDTYTMEFEEASGDDVAEMEFGYGITTDLEISGDAEGVGEMSWKMFGRETQDSTKTAALTVPTLEVPASLLWGVYFDPSWANLGSTQITGQIYNFRWTYNNAVHPGYYLDGRSDLDFSVEEFGRPMSEIEFDVIHDPDSAAFVQVEEALKSAGTLRFVSLELVGASLGGSNYTAKLQGAYYHMADSMQERGNDRDGNIMTRVHLGSAYDPTAAKHVQAIIINNLATFPA
jgi:hypothetical protein